MELRQLEYFCKIIETGSINEAARRLNMSQPPLSLQIKKLEDELGVSLLARTGRGVSPTIAGKLLYERACSLLEYTASMNKEVQSIGKRRVLRMGITSSTATTVLPIISRFTKEFPDVDFEVRDGASQALFQQLLDGIIDISVVRTPLRLDEVNSKLISKEPMIAVSPSSQRFEEKSGMTENITLSDLTDSPLILYRRYEELIRAAFSRRSIKPDIFCVCDDARDAMLWVRQGLATAIFPDSMRKLCSDLTVKVLAEQELYTSCVLIWKKDNPPLPIVKDFLKFC